MNTSQNVDVLWSVPRSVCLENYVAVMLEKEHPKEMMHLESVPLTCD